MVKVYRTPENGAMTAFTVRFGTVLKAVRLGQGLSQEHLAALAGIERGFVGKLERGEANPSLLTLLKLSKALNEPLSELFARYESSKDDESL